MEIRPSHLLLCARQLEWFMIREHSAKNIKLLQLERLSECSLQPPTVRQHKLGFIGAENE